MDVELVKNSGLGSLFFYAIKRIGVLLMGGAVFACQSSTERQLVTFSGPVMGTEYRIKINLSAQRETNKNQLDALEQGVLQQMQQVNALMSTYLKDSEVSRFNSLSATTDFTLSEPLRQVIEESLEISKISEGAFDITVGRAVNLWGFGANGRISKTPTDQQLVAIRQSTGYQNLRLNGLVLSKLHNDTTVDLSAIAKGFAVDQVARYLETQQQHDFLVEIGGELRASGINAEGNFWLVAIERPQTLGGIQQVVELNDSAIATSGDYRNYIVIDGKQYSHTIEPHSLQPITHKLASVSIVNDHASTADALATAILVMGEKRGFKFANEHDLAAYFIIRGQEQGEFEIKTTDKFASILR